MEFESEGEGSSSDSSSSWSSMARRGDEKDLIRIQHVSRRVGIQFILEFFVGGGSSSNSSSSSSSCVRNEFLNNLQRFHVDPGQHLLSPS